MNELVIKTFERPEYGQIRAMMKGDEPWFVAADICRALSIGNPSKALQDMDEDEKGITTSNTPGGPQDVLTVSEPGLYALVFKSRKPAAKAFQRWVRHEVIPAVRKTGTYSLPAAPEQKPITKAQLQVFNAFYNIAKIDHNQKLLALDRLIHRGTGISPLEEAKVTLVSPIQDHLLTPTEIGRAVTPHLSAQKVNKILERLGLQHKEAGEWVPNEDVDERYRGRVCDTGKKQGNGAPVKQTKWPTANIALVQGKVPRGLFASQGGSK